MSKRSEIYSSTITEQEELDAINAIIAENKALKIELAEYESLIALQHRRSVKASKLWQKAHGEKNCWPDLGKLLEWLMEERRKALAEVKRLKEVLR